MTYRLTESDLARMRAEHVPVKIDGWLWCAACTDAVQGTWRVFPCAAAELLAHFAPGPVPHLAWIEERLHVTVYPPSDRNPMVKRVLGIAQPDDPAISYGLLGPSTAEELAR